MRKLVSLLIALLLLTSYGKSSEIKWEQRTLKTDAPDENTNGRLAEVVVRDKAKRVAIFHADDRGIVSSFVRAEFEFQVTVDQSKILTDGPMIVISGSHMKPPFLFLVQGKDGLFEEADQETVARYFEKFKTAKEMTKEALLKALGEDGQK